MLLRSDPRILDPQDHREILDNLRQRIEASPYGSRQSGRRQALGIDALDQFLPANGLPAGALVELLSGADGVGVWTLCVMMGVHACGDKRALMIVDQDRCFYPPAAVKLGLDLGRTIVVRPPTRLAGYTAMEQGLRCAAIGAVIGRCKQLSFADCRRLQLAAEAGGGIGLVLRHEQARAAPSFAALRLRVTPVASVLGRQQVRVEPLHWRATLAHAVVLEIDDETGHVRISTEVAAAKAKAR